MGIKEMISGVATRQGERGDKKKPNMLIIWITAAAAVVLAISGFVGGKEDKADLQSDGVVPSEYAEQQEKKLETVLKRINGAGEVSVYININDGGEKVLARDNKSKLSKDDGGKYSEESESLVTSGGSRSGEPYIVEEKVPEISGVLVVASGAASDKVRAEIYDAVRAVYGIAAHRIKVTY